MNETPKSSFLKLNGLSTKKSNLQVIQHLLEIINRFEDNVK